MNYIKQTPPKKNSKKFFLALLATFLLATTVVGIVVGVVSRRNSDDNANSNSPPSHAIIKSACSSTLYPELCFSTITSEPSSVTNKVSTHKDVILLSLNISTGTVERNYFTIKKLINQKGRSKREKVALHDCLETIDESLDELKKAIDELKDYPTSKKSLFQHADDLKTLLSSAITNQETCLDGFSHDEACKRTRKNVEGGQVHVERLCSNALAMVKNLTDTDMANDEKNKMMVGSNNRKLKEEGEIKWPEWISTADRRLLQSSTITPNVVVAADGSGNYRTVSAAVAAAPENSAKRYVIRIKAGVYKENVDVPKKKTNIMFLGDGRSNTIITASKNVADGSTTFNSATVGTVDFIFGNSAVVLQNCDIHARRPDPGQKNMLTAQGRTDPNQNTAGWFEWDGNFALNTLFYGEYQNTGPGASTSGRVKWKGYKVITSATEAQTYTPRNFIAGSGWLGSTGFPFSLDL
ncbi:hypothetical protein TanjilG_22656 [Lupinus angustifolius]|uniref:Pectinesterase n=1 Tax=Lupinus angustifolius TaxID=3871 RepID=A0A4P1RTA9_LUPAN|nr:hypothetical protein TanjilG_22656 [Lupinus angustifolius]